MKHYTKTLDLDQKKSLVHRMHSHTEVKDIAVVVLTAKELSDLLDHIFYLEAEVKSYERGAAAINQALNEGNGTYKP